ncbi:MAG: riboflavin synthase [Chloroflexota bacterium]|nr:riboflavin synthase [Chloroflexota bacterium]
MFTGIVEETGKVQILDKHSLRIYASTVLSETRLGDSIAVNGTCLTVVEMDKSGFSVDLAPETLRRTGFGLMKAGDTVNLERALALKDRLGGHIVQGHIDGTGRITSMKPESECVIFTIRCPKKLMPYIVSKGFVAVDGISLTVVKRNTASFTISVIPYTLEHTNLKGKVLYNTVNLEVDIIAKYVEALVIR